MFKCGICRKDSLPRETATRVVLQTRSRTYPFRKMAHRNGNDDPGGRGSEIVREVLVHRDCAMSVKGN